MHNSQIVLRLIFILHFGTLLFHSAYAQCSDAGACSVKLHSSQAGLQIQPTIEFGQSGKADDLSFLTLKLFAQYEVVENSTVSFAVPFSRVSGPLGSVSGLGDAIILWDQRFFEEEEREFHVQAGAKVATGAANKGGLPQTYQTGLGTNDMLLGALYRAEDWRFNISYQYSPGRSENSLTRLYRGDDVVARVERKMQFKPIEASVSLLAVKRLGISSVRDALSAAESFVDVAGSDQFQLNLAADLLYPLDTSKTFVCGLAFPLLKRAVNVDGLTRAFTVSAGVMIGF
jgi:hypothetical protein